MLLVREEMGQSSKKDQAGEEDSGSNMKQTHPDQRLQSLASCSSEQ